MMTCKINKNFINNTIIIFLQTVRINNKLYKLYTIDFDAYTFFNPYLQRKYKNNYDFFFLYLTGNGMI